MLSRNVESIIEDFKNKYIGSLKERQEIKNAYIKCNGNIPKMFKYVPLTDDCKSKKRIISIINQMISNGEVVKFPDKSKITTQSTIDDEAPGTSGLNNISTPSRTEQTIIELNTSNPSLYPLAGSTPHSTSNFSTNTFSNNSYIGIEDILKMKPGFMNDSRTTTITNSKGTETGKEKSSSKLNFLRNNGINDNTINSDTIEFAKCHDTPSRKRQTEHEWSGKKLKVHDNSTNGREFVESNEETPYTTILSSADQAAKTEERQISDKRNMTNSNQICGTNDLTRAITYSEDTVMHTACLLALPTPNSYRDQSTSIADYKKTAEKNLNHSKNIQVHQNVSLTTMPVQNEQKLKNVDESRTSEGQIRDKRVSKTAHQEKPTANIPMDTGKTRISTTADEINSKSSTSDSSKSVCSKTEVTNKRIPLSKCLKTKNEKMKYTEKCLILIRELFSKYIKSLPDAEKKLLKLFNEESNKGQCICLELLTSHKKWYNVFNFSRKVRPDMEDNDIFEVVTAFKEKGIIDIDYESEHEVVLLNQLSKENLIKICDDLEKEGLKIYNRHNPEEKLTTKKIIEIIQRHCNTKSKIDLLREKIQNRMGNCMKINKNFQEVFYIVYLLGTYTNPRFLKMKDYFKSILVDNVTFPEYSIDKYAIFTSWGDCVSYSKAKMYEIEFKNSSHGLAELRQICGKIFAELKLIKNKRSDHERLKEAPHLIQFTAKAVYVSTLSDACLKLLDKYPNIVKGWLEYMIRYMKAEFPHEIGGWYYNLIAIYTQFLKPFDYNRAAEELINVLKEERQHLSGIQLYRIFQMGRKLVRKDEIFQKNKDYIVELEVKLLPKRITNFPETIIDGKSGMTNQEYYHTLLSSTWGGEIILASFTLFFHDIIYNTRKFIPGTFVSNIQSEPLDMNTRYFYANRQDEIEQRLRKIESEWSDNKVISFLKENYVKHSHEFAICKIDDIIKDAKTLENLVQGFGRRILANIYRRMAENFTEHRRGFPDLLISDTEKKKYFRMVKRSRHKLSIEQLLWLDYLRSDETEVEIIVIPADNYKNVKKIKKNDLPNASSAPDTVA